MMKNKKHLFGICIVVAAGMVCSLAFNNMTSMSPREKSVRMELIKLNARLADTSRAPDFLAAVRNHKFRAINVLASHAYADSCATLLSFDQNPISATYTLYRQSDPRKPMVVRCEFANGAVTQETLVRNIEYAALCSANGTCEQKTVVMNIESGNYSETRVPAPGIVGLPRLLQKNSQARCQPDVDFGTDGNEIWIKNGCRGTFSVTQNNPLKDKLLSGAVTRPAVFKGKVRKILVDGTKVSISGWACEQGLANSATIQVYASGAAGVGKSIGMAKADLPSPISNSEDADCQTPGKNHSFNVEIDLDIAQSVRGEDLYIYALSTTTEGAANARIPEDAKIYMPGALNAHLGTATVPGANACHGQCSLEDPRNYNSQGGLRYMINNDPASVRQRCRELGFNSGESTGIYTHKEWCAYSNARTKSWDGSKWVLGGCAAENVKAASCHDDANAKVPIVSSADTAMLNWTNLGESYTYSLDVRRLKNGTYSAIAPCRDESYIKTSTSWNFRRYCQTGDVVAMTSDTQVRICAAKASKWSAARCSNWTPIAARVQLTIP